MEGITLSVEDSEIYREGVLAGVDRETFIFNGKLIIGYGTCPIERVSELFKDPEKNSKIIKSISREWKVNLYEKYQNKE